MNWFVLKVKPQHEKAVAEQLRIKSLEGYVPLYRSKRVWSDRVKTLDLPLFPRYVFSRFGFDDRTKVLSITSVLSLVGFGGTPCAVPEHEIERVKSMVNSGLPVLPWPALQAGQHVRICAGSLSGLEGILVRQKSACRVVVNVELLQRAVAVEIERDLVELCKGPVQA